MDIKDLMLEVAAEMQEVIRSVMEDLARPQMMRQLRAMWMQAPEELKDRFALEHPQEYAELMEEIQ